MNDKEPIRYYDWMLWKMRQLDKEEELKKEKIYESPDNGKTVYVRDLNADPTTRIELDPADRNWEYDGDGSKIYKPEVGFGTKTPVAEGPPEIGDLSRIGYKYNENQLIAEFKEYVDETYGLHYSRDKFQATEFIIDGGHGTGFCIGNVLKYAQRYGKKGTRNDARKDLMKVLHYALLQLYVHDKES